MTDDVISAPSEELSMTDDLAVTPEGDDLELTMEDTPADLEELSLETARVPAAAPAPLPKMAVAPVSEDDAEDLTADEVSDADADAFEEKLNASIAEEEAFPEVEDANSIDRLEAMKLVEEGGDEADQVHESLAVGASFDNLEIDHDEEVFDDEQGASSMPSATHGSAGFEFVGFDLTGDRVTLNFSSGASVAIDPRMITQNSRRDLTVGGKKISLGHVDGGLEVEVDGVAIFLPKRAA